MPPGAGGLLCVREVLEVVQISTAESTCLCSILEEENSLLLILGGGVFVSGAAVLVCVDR